MKSYAVALLVVFATIVSADRTLNACDGDVNFNNLHFRFGSMTAAPSFNYWNSMDNSHNEYLINFDRIYAINKDGMQYQFANGELSNWEWNLRGCSLSCVMMGDYEMCEAFFDGNNKEAMDSAKRMDMTINLQVFNKTGVDMFNARIWAFGNEMKYVLANYNTFEMGMKFNCASGSCNPFNSGSNFDDTYVNFGSGYSHLSILTSMFSLQGLDLDECNAQKGVDERDELCGLRDMKLMLDGENMPRLSVSWDNATNYERLYLETFTYVKFDNNPPLDAEDDDDVIIPPVVVIDDEEDDDDVLVGAVADEDDDDDLSDGAIAGIAIGSFFGLLLILALIGLLIWLLMRKGKDHRGGAGFAKGNSSASSANQSHV